MQDVSYDPLMLCPSENPQASLDIFSQPHHHPSGSYIYRKAINKDKPSCPRDSILPRIVVRGNRSKSFWGLRSHSALGLPS